MEYFLGLKEFFGGWETILLQYIFMGLILIVIIIIVLFKCTTKALPALIISYFRRKDTNVMASQQKSPFNDPDPEKEFYDLYEIEIGIP